MQEITIKGLVPRYKCYLKNNQLLIYNEKGVKLGSTHWYNSQQTSYTLYCEDGKRRSFYELRLLYAYSNDISVLDIPKGCIYKTKYGLDFYNKRKVIERPKRETLSSDIIKQIKELDEYWDKVKSAIFSNDVTEISNILISHKEEVMKRCFYSTGVAREVIEDCFNDAVCYYLSALVNPKRKINICMPNDALTTYTIKRIKTITKYNGK
jgi:hypothetical protein